MMKFWNILLHGRTLKHYAKWNKPGIQGQILHDSNIWDNKNRQIYRERKNSGCRELRGGRNGELLLNGYTVLVWDDGKVLEKDNGEVAQQCECI